MKNCTQFFLSLILCAFIFATRAFAQDWGGPFRLAPVSAPEMALEAVGSGTAEGNIISIGHPTTANNQIWIVTKKEKNLYAIHPATSPDRVLTVADGGANNGTRIVLQTDTGKPWQRWSMVLHADGSVSLLAGHAPDKGLDDFGGKSEPGARQDLWEYRATDEHLHWTIKPLTGAKTPKEFAAIAERDALTPKGVMKTFTFTNSRIFPGTHRKGWVFIPAQYNAAKPACVYVRQDGYNPAEKGMLESLIASGDMPVTVGVFVSPGELPSPVPGTMGRRNRDFEYDAVNDDYVRFLIDELLPYVAKEFTLNFSSSGNDRCIAGGSSGGIAAFNAAWHRPDAFSRVYANSGSFVAFRGGHEFPTMIRKFEAKPIRAYLTTGTHDMVNCAGDWYLLDQEMDQALKFSGYDYSFVTIEGPHVAGWNEHFPKAMRFIWKGWPEPVKAGPSAPRVRDVILPGQGWTLAAEGFHDARGPAMGSQGEVYFADPAADKVFRVGLDGKVNEFLSNVVHAGAVAVGVKGELFTVSESSGQVVSYKDGSRDVIAEGIPGRQIVGRPDSTLYVSGPGATADAASRIWRIAGGKIEVVDTGLKRATGLAYRPDQWLLAAADGGSKWIYSFQINADGTLADKERYFHLHVQDWDDDAGAESVCYAREGQLLVATRAGVQICADDGPTQVILPVPDGRRVLGVCLGGKDRDTLFAFCGRNIWKRKVKLHGIGAFSPRTSVSATPL